MMFLKAYCHVTEAKMDASADYLLSNVLKKQQKMGQHGYYI